MGEFLRIFNEQLVKVLTRSTNGSSKLVKFIDDSSEFDFSFPISMKIWRNQFKTIAIEDIEKYQDNILNYASESFDGKSDEFLVSKSNNWIFSIASVHVAKSHCFISLRRVDVYEKCLKSIRDDFGKLEKSELDTVHLQTENTIENQDSLTQYRVELIASVLENLLTYSKFVQVEDSSTAKHKILVTSKSNPKKDEIARNDSITIVCGPVISTKDNKISNESTRDFVQQRMNDMHLIAVHKYGVRLKSSDALETLVKQLGESAAKLDLLEVKHTSALKLTSDPKKAFIMYNSARIETLLEKFEEKEKERYYDKLPAIDEVDMKLLVEDDEWKLMKIILTFPDVVNNSISGLAEGKVSIISIHTYLTSLVNTFSIYYRRVRLLTSNQTQLMPSLHAKIHFVRMVRTILNKTLAIFGIQPVAFM